MTITFAGSPVYVLQIALGTIGTLAMFCRFVYCGDVKLIVTALPDTVAPLIGSPPVLMSGYCFNRLYVKATSAGPKDEPSLNFTPERMVNVMDVPPAPHV